MKTKISSYIGFGILVMMIMVTVRGAEATEFRRLSVNDYRDKMKAGWIGQIVGVTWFASTECKYIDVIIPEAEVPKWLPRMINNAFGQDDLYVEMTFLRSMEQYGLDVSIRQAGIDFANSGYQLWCANDAGRKNLRKGIAPPDSSHPKFNKCPNDIDYQIEADYSGLIAPGMPNVVIAMGEKFGRIMNYGDGLYAGQLMGAMYAESFFENDIVKVIEAGLKAIPDGSQYAEMVRDLLKWSKECPTWEECWQRCQEKYRKNRVYHKASTGVIDCRINGAYVLMGLLYGKGDLDKTIQIAGRSGLDSDCNPSSAGGVLFTTVGFSKLPERFTKELNEKTIFNHTAYNVPGLLDVCEKLARQAIVKEGGRIERDKNGEEFFLIPVKPVKPSKLEPSWAPGPIEGSMFTQEEMAKQTRTPTLVLKQGMEKTAPGWAIDNLGNESDSGFRENVRGHKNVLVTHPLDKVTPCVLSRQIEIPAGKKTSIKLTVGRHPAGDWDLVVRADMRELLRKPVDKTTAPDGWLDVFVDLSEYQGKSVLMELYNQPSGWNHEAAYWEKISIVTE